MLFGVGFGAGGVFLIDSMARNSKLWLLAIAIPMIMVKRGQAQKETTNGYISAIRNKLYHVMRYNIDVICELVLSMVQYYTFIRDMYPLNCMTIIIINLET